MCNATWHNGNDPSHPVGPEISSPLWHWTAFPSILGESFVAKLDSLENVGVFVKNLKNAKQFYTRKVGLALRDEMKKFGYVALGATKGGADAELNLWAPELSWGAERYESGLKQIGGVTGVGFLSFNLAKTIEALKARGVDAAVDTDSPRFGRFTDPDGNVVFIVEPAKVKVKRAGLAALTFVTVASRDRKKAGAFFTKTLGMKALRMPGEDQNFTSYALNSKGTSITPFTPTKEMYTNPADYDADMAHIGEQTSIGFTSRDVYGLQEALMGKGVRFTQKAEKKDWGGIQARFLDPDDNEYSVVQSP